MTITQLKYVLAVSEHKNFTRAAEHVFVTQPTLSMQIQKLEEELNILIFDRSKKPIELTNVGKKIVNQARSIVNEAERMQDVVDQEKGFIGGEFKLGIIPTIMPTLLPMFLKNFTSKYPKVNLKIENSFLNRGFTLVYNDQLYKDKLISKKIDPIKVKTEEGKILLKKISSSDTVILLDESGKSLSSNAFSKEIENYIQKLSQMAIAWLLRKPQITSVLVGSSSSNQLKENVKALDNLVFNHEELKLIDGIIS